MKISERLRKKIKQNFPQIDYIDNVTFYRGYGVPDGVKFSWFAIDHTHDANPMLYSYDTMTDCLSFNTQPPKGGLVTGVQKNSFHFSS